MVNSKGYYVYAIINKSSPGEYKVEDKKLGGKPLYIGMGSTNRHSLHLTPRSLKTGTKGRYFSELIGKGNELGSEIIFGELEEKEALVKEKEIIAKFGRQIDGGILINNLEGGQTSGRGLKHINSKKVYQYTLDGNFVQEWDCVRCIQREGKQFIHYNTVADSCRGNIGKEVPGYSGGGFVWVYEDRGLKIPKYKPFHPQSRMVYIYCLFTLNLKVKIEGILEASKIIGVEKTVVSASIIKKRRVKKYICSYEPLSKKTLSEIRDKHVLWRSVKVPYEHFTTLKEACDYHNLPYSSKPKGEYALKYYNKIIRKV